jgi:hypothetical protein
MHNQGWYLGAELSSAERAALSVRIAERRRRGLHHRAESKRGLSTSWSTIGFSSAALPRKSATDSLSAVAPWSHSGFPRAANLFVSGSSHDCKSIYVRTTCEPGGHHASIVVFRCYPCRGVLSHRGGMSQSVNVRPLYDEHYKGIQQRREQSAAWRRWDSRHWLVSLSSVDRHRSACG